MREEYFMNYDFLRKHGEKLDKNGKCFRMLDFEDGGMYFGIVEDDLPSGLGAFVYSDLKFHCGYYSEGLMKDMSRIHFGNGDVFDGMTDGGKMHGEGFFFDCENNDWVFGVFEADNCVEVIEHGEGFPRTEIAKFRSLYHQSGHQYYGRETEPLLLDLDLLIEYANRDISHLRPEIIPVSDNRNLEENQENHGEEEEREEGMEEEDHDDYQEHEYLSNKASNTEKGTGISRSDAGMKQNDDKNFTSQGNNAETKRISTNYHGLHMKESNLTKRIHISAPKNDSKPTSAYGSRKVETDFNPVERRMLLIPEVNTVSPALLDADTLRTPLKSQKEVLKKTPGNQIVQGANMIKPKSQINQKETSAQAYSESEGMNQHSKISHHMKLNDISGVSSVRDKDESRDLRNISIQTEDKLADTYYKNDEASLSYLKGIHSMIDELKQMVSDKIVVGRETEKVEESILFKITEVKKQVEQSLSGKNNPPYLEPHIPVLPFQPGSILGNLNFGMETGHDIINGYKSEGSGLPPETRIPLTFNSVPVTQTGNLWNMTIDQRLEEKRMKDIEEALAKKFGKLDDSEKPQSEILEPIKESADGEEDEDAVNGRNTKPEGKRISQQRMNLEGLWESSFKPGSLGETSQHNTKVTIPTEDQTEKPENLKNLKDRDEIKDYGARGLPKRPTHEEITEADERNFYTGEPIWGEVQRKTSWGGQAEEGVVNRNDFQQSESRSVDLKATQKSDTMIKVNLPNSSDVERFIQIPNLETYELKVGNLKEKSLSFGTKEPLNEPNTHFQLEQIKQDSERNRDSNFMYSRKGNESCNNGSLLPGMTSHNGKGSSLTPWYFLNPYLYEATYEVDMSHY